MTQEFPSIALLTDFGLQDTYVGVMKGVMLDICPEARLIDLTHAIRPQDVRQAALALLDSYRYLPRRTVFLVVVDPGVGSTRRAIAVDAGPYWFVGPDNGVLSYALREIGEWEAFELTNDRYWLPDSSNTFHGRDIFAPVAAHIAYGSSVKPFSLGELGTPIDDPVLLPPPLLVTTAVQIVGEIIDIDHYGTLVTSIGRLAHEAGGRLSLAPRFDHEASLQRFDIRKIRIRAGGYSIRGIRRAFSDVESGQLVALVGSRGYLEIAVNRGNAAKRLGLSMGDQVELEVWED